MDMFLNYRAFNSKGLSNQENTVHEGHFVVMLMQFSSTVLICGLDHFSIWEKGWLVFGSNGEKTSQPCKPNLG